MSARRCDCGAPAVKMKANGPCCGRCDKLEIERIVHKTPCQSPDKKYLDVHLHKISESTPTE